LTAHQAKPAVRFAGSYRIVDFVLANMVNSRIPAVFLLGQYKPATLIEHVETTWRHMARAAGVVIESIVPTAGEPAYAGTADAVYRCIDLVEHHLPDVVAVFAADHIYRMDVRQMVGYHLSRNADVTIAGVPVPIDSAASFGIMETDDVGAIRRFREKPSDPAAMSSRPGYALASMGNYLFKAETLTALLRETINAGGADFGKDIMPTLAHRGLKAIAYDFCRNVLPGIKPYEERGYWRDVGTLDALERAQRDVEGPRPKFDLQNRAWPIRKDLLERLEAPRRIEQPERDRIAA
jgi:glucose-1-phosphate adenylyltransferase